MGYYSDLDAEGPYRTCGEADEARRHYPAEYRMAAYHNPDDDNAPGSPPPTEPAPDECRNCAGAHHIQSCPEILAALFAPLTGAEIARAWHRNYRRFARRVMQKPASERIHAAYLYSQYMAEHLPKQRYSLTIENTLVAWHRAAA